jgi:hypothetical protein
LVLLVAVIALPAIVFPFPPLLDYPNHLARIWLITGGVDIAPVSSFYVEDWRHVASGIGADLAAKTLGTFIPPFTLGTILLILAMLLPPLGAIALNARLFGGLNGWQPFFLLFWCSQTLIAGFLNFQIGIGAGLLAAAADPVFKRRGPWALTGARVGLGILLMLIHPFGLLFYACLLAGMAFGAETPVRGGLPERFKRAAMAAAFCVAPLALFFIWIRTIPGIDDKNSTIVTPNDVLGEIHALASPFSSYDLKVDFLFALPLTALVIYGLVKRKFSVHFGLLVVAAVFATIAPFVPKNIGHTGWMSYRLPLMAVLTALAATRLNFEPRSKTHMLAAALVMVTLRTAWIGLNWSASVPMIEAMRQVLAEVPAGAKVLPMQHKSAGHYMTFNVLGRHTAMFDETFRHYPALAIPWRHAFTPMLFAQYREKPITPRPPYDQISVVTGGMLPSVNALNNPRYLNKRTQFIRKWRENFDYVLVLNADRPDMYGPFLPPADLMLVADRGFAQLYRVRKTAEADRD